MTEKFHYGRLMHKAMRGLMIEVLNEVAEKGLPGAHHFFITFDTRHPGVDISKALHERYPEDMTIVIQHQYDDFAVLSDRFAITLNFSDIPEPLVVPYAAVNTFVDPSVEFGLRFDAYEDDDDTSPDDPKDDTPPKGKPDGTPDGTDGGDVVSLDKFRKH